MPIDENLLKRARENPKGLRFEEAVQLAEQLGFREVHRKGSHRIYRHEQGEQLRSRFPRPLNLQCGQNGKAKVYQVKQMLKMAKDIGII
jgi:hypothetical protein